MKNFLTNTVAGTALVLSLIAGPALTPAWAKTMLVKDIEVSADVGSIKNPQAAQYFANLETDLHAAIAARLADLATTGQSEKGVTVSVNINSVELANSFQTLTNLADSKLEGNVNVFDDQNTALKSFTLAVSVKQAAAFFPEGTDLSALTLDTPVYYQAMINAFADAVAARIAE